MTAPKYINRSYAGAAEVSALMAGIGAPDLSFSINPTTDWPTGSNGPFTVTLDKGLVSEERILCASLNPATGLVAVYQNGGWTGRGYDGTNAQGHLSGTNGGGPAEPTWSAAEAQEANDVVAAVMGGAASAAVGEILTVGAGGAPAFAPSSLAGGIPTGLVCDFAGGVIPSGWLLCDGSNKSRTTYAALFAAIGTAYGAGDGSTTFGLPNAEDRFTVGAGVSYGLGATGGAALVSLTAAQLAAHTHGIAPHAHLGLSGFDFIVGSTAHSTLFVNSGADIDHSPAWNLGGDSQTANANLGTDGGTGLTGAAHENRPPYIGFYKIIRAV